MSEILQTSGRKIVKTPGECFRVEPKKINWKLFEKERKDPQQEALRKLIKEAQGKLEANPERYGRRFETQYEYFGQVKEYSATLTSKLIKREKLKDIAEISEQAFEIAQKISNGETWESFCNAPDPYEYPRLIIGDSYVSSSLFMRSSETYYLFGGEELGSPANYKIIKPDGEKKEYDYKSGIGGGDVGPIGERYVTVRGDIINAEIALLLVHYLDTYKTPLEKHLDQMKPQSMITFKL